jgi:hypothetical protein
MVQDAINQCLASPPPVTIDKLLTIGCRRVAGLDDEGREIIKQKK